MPFGSSTSKMKSAIQGMQKPSLSSRAMSGAGKGITGLGKGLVRGADKLIRAPFNPDKKGWKRLSADNQGTISKTVDKARQKVRDVFGKKSTPLAEGKLSLKQHRKRFNLDNTKNTTLLEDKLTPSKHRRAFNLDKDQQKELMGKFSHLKIGKITSQAQRAKMKAYRMQHKAELARKAKIRRRKQRTGQQRKKKRIGTAANGFSFVMDPQSGPSFSTSPGRSSSGGSSVSMDFKPDKHTGTTEKLVKLK